MLRCGLSSATFRNSEAKEVINLASASGLEGIEWTADTHVPHGDFARAEELMMATLRAGLTISSYGSFVRLGRQDRAEEMLFRSALETALRLNAPALRVWTASETDPHDADSLDRLAAVCLKAADETGKRGVTLCVEAHERSPLDTYGALETLLSKAEHPFLAASWTPLPGKGADRSLSPLMAPRTLLARVRAWTKEYERVSLDGAEDWRETVRVLAREADRAALDRWALIEYLEDESEGTLIREASVLRESAAPA